MGGVDIAALQAKAGLVDGLQRQVQDLTDEITRLKARAPTNSTQIEDFLQKCVAEPVNNIGKRDTQLTPEYMQVIHKTIQDTSLNGIKDESKQILRKFAQFIIDMSVVTKTNREFQKFVVDSQINNLKISWMAERSALVQEETIKRIFELIVPGNTGFKTIKELLNMRKNISSDCAFEKGKNWIVVESKVNNPLTHDNYTCLKLSSSRDPVEPAPLLCEDIASFLIKQNLMLASHLRMFTGIFTACIVKQDLAFSKICMEYFFMIEKQINFLKIDHEITKRAKNCGETLMNVKLKSKLPILLLIQGYCLGGLFADNIQLEFQAPRLKALTPPMTMDDIRDLMDRVLVNPKKPDGTARGFGDKDTPYGILLEITQTVLAPPP